MRLKKWYMILEGPEYKEGFAYTDPCSEPHEREIVLVEYSSYERIGDINSELMRTINALKSRIAELEKTVRNWEANSRPG